MFDMDQYNKVCNPIVPSCRLNNDENSKSVDGTSYKQMVGSLIYLLAIRPDLAYSVCLVARYMEKPTKTHLEITKNNHKVCKGNYEHRSFIQDE